MAVYAFALARPAFFLGAYDYVAARINGDTTVSTTAYTTSFEKEEDGFIDFADISFPEVDPRNEGGESTGSPIGSAAGETNRLIVPAMGVDAGIIESASQEALMQGVWHIPGSARPGEDGNIVIAAHRWLHKPPHPETFYLIDKLKVGDPIFYDFNGTRYEYRVTKTFIVNPDDVEILAQDENKLTLFTCTPLYSTKQRYVVTAELVS